ncbi:GDSL-type esterase/lipase family protein [Sphingomonas sp.]|uniref:GDSL-type esterase/lipase family protein n=1 Tax=Sphingomonas sp. TaxID=28214 RepID=UPI0025E4B5A9|nr:GDSL-type esterase/lipase family protein [Sphingomonas sp.]MBV9526923.1 GDSL family lipase [Sphingomonas sp.]
MLSRRNLIHGTLAAPLTLASATALADTFEDQCKAALTPHMDFPQLGRYRHENARLIKSRAPVDVVFMGDSITEGWKDKRPGFFSTGRIDRGISGQTTPQMVLRMMADVVELKPRAVHIMAGTNDVAGNTGPMTPAMTENNFEMMSDIARAHGVKVLVASIPPAASFPWRPGLETRSRIKVLNAWLKTFASASGATFVDYWPVLDDGTGAMKPGLASDGVHPTEAGYDAMATVVEPILARALRHNRRA